jgi:hypothetical protein
VAKGWIGITEATHSESEGKTDKSEIDTAPEWGICSVKVGPMQLAKLKELL